MKYLLFIPVLGLAFASISCRTLNPIDPMTMDPSTECLPPYPRPVEPHSSK